MNINITSRKFKAKDSLKAFISDSIRALQKLSDDIMEADVVLHFTHAHDSIKSVEIQLKLPGRVLNVHEDSEDFQKSVHMAIEKLERQLRKVKTKRLAKAR